MRRNIPVFFEQIGLRAAIDINWNGLWLLEHFRSIFLKWKKIIRPLIYLIDLLNQKGKVKALIIAILGKRELIIKLSDIMKKEYPKENYS